MLKSALFRVFDTMCIAILLSFTTIVEAQRDQQEDYYSRSVEHWNLESVDSLSYSDSRSATSKLRDPQDNSYLRSALSRKFKDSQDIYYIGSSYSKSIEHNLQSHRESGTGQSDSQGSYG